MSVNTVLYIIWLLKNETTVEVVLVSIPTFLADEDMEQSSLQQTIT